MRAADIPDVVDIASTVHPAFFERPAVFSERRALFPAGAWLLERAGRGAGYLVSHPWHDGPPPALDSLIGALPSSATTYYLHDLALLPGARGAGAAGTAIAWLAVQARALKMASMTLVAVNESRGFWEKQGFCVVDRPEMAAKLASYGPAAVMMERRLD